VRILLNASLLALAACAAREPVAEDEVPAAEITARVVHAEGEAYGYVESQGLRSARLNCCVELESACQQTPEIRLHANGSWEIEGACEPSPPDGVFCRSRCVATCGGFRDSAGEGAGIGDFPPYYGRDDRDLVPTISWSWSVPCW
jgi:hypothetical protein